MRPKARPRWLLLPVLLAALASRGEAFVVPVYDAKSDYNQYVQIVKMAQQIEMGIRQMRRLEKLQRYRALYLRSWALNAARNTYGRVGKWTGGLNGGDPILIAHGQDRVSIWNELQDLPQAELKKFGKSQVEVENTATHVDLIDNSIRDGIRAIGTYRYEAGQLDRQLLELQGDALSVRQDRDALLQKIAIANTIVAHQLRYTNRMLAALLEQQVVAAQGQRDLKVRAINEDVYFHRAADGLYGFARNPAITFLPGGKR